MKQPLFDDDDTATSTDDTTTSATRGENVAYFMEDMDLFKQYSDGSMLNHAKILSGKYNLYDDSEGQGLPPILTDPLYP